MSQELIIKVNLDMLFDKTKDVFITMHNSPDFDAIGAAIGMEEICKARGKNAYIVLNETLKTLSKEVSRIYEEVSIDYPIINSKEASKIIDKDSLLIIVDTNVSYLVPLRRELNRFNNIFILDHHNEGINTINTKYKYINPERSSTCETIASLLDLYNVKLSKKYADYLLAGILLDTKRLSKNASKKTIESVLSLMDKGADMKNANLLFAKDFEEDQKMRAIINNTKLVENEYALAIGTNGIYSQIILAKAADYLLDFDVKATFAVGYIEENVVSVSARSKGEIDVSSVMKLFGGGGNKYSAAAMIKGITIEEIENKINEIINNENKTLHIEKKLI